MKINDVKKTEQFYDELYKKQCIQQAKKATIPNLVKKQYELCKPELDGIISEEQYAAYTSGGFNPNKSGIGEKAQLQSLRQVLPELKALPKIGKNALRMCLTDGQHSIKYGANKQKGIKSFDFIYEHYNIVELYLAKTLDIGVCSVSKGGGHQDNVLDEINSLLKAFTANNIALNGKAVHLTIVIDGRNAQYYIDKLEKEYNDLRVKITSCDEIVARYSNEQK